MTVVNCTREQRMINVYCKTKAKTKKSVLSFLRRLSGTFAAERRRLQHGARSAHLQLSIDISCPQGAKRQQTRWLPLLLSIDGTYRRTDRRTDAQPLHRYCSAYYADSVNKQNKTRGRRKIFSHHRCGREYSALRGKTPCRAGSAETNCHRHARK